MMELVWPAEQYLAGYADALRRGWSPDNLRPEASAEELLEIDADPHAFIESQVDREAKGPRIALPDGTLVERLPGYHKWIWDGEFCGSVGFRWRPGTPELPPTCLGHIGYGVVPWKRGRGYATRALALILPDARREGLPWVEITTDVSNTASQKVILANGGRLKERFHKLPQHGGTEGLRFRIDLG